MLKNELIKQDILKIKTALIEKGFSPLSDAWVLSDKGILGKGLLKDYKSGDTPIFHFEPSRNELIYHDESVAMHKEWFNPQAMIEKVIDNVAATTVEKVLADVLG